jgi:hypothetical protein
MAEDGAHQTPPEPNRASERNRPSERRGWSARLGSFFGKTNSVLSYAKGLPVITLVGSLLVGYFQYLNAYQDKVSAQAKEDMSAATTTFTDIAKAFSEAQTLQQILFFDFSAALDDNTDTDGKALTTKDAQNIFPTYEQARTMLRQNSDLLARKAEIYIDWASDFDRDPAQSRAPTTDPLTQSLLGAYNFDCDDGANFPRFETASPAPKDASGKSTPDKTQANPCLIEDQGNHDPDKSYINLCARQNGKIVPGKPAITIHWYSTKHQVLTMHYCFQALHARLVAARDWASQSELSAPAKAKFLAEREQTRTELGNQVIRLNSFMSLAMFQMENIRVKYRPLGFACHIPFVTPIVSLFSRYCTPIRTAPAR